MDFPMVVNVSQRIALHVINALLELNSNMCFG